MTPPITAIDVALCFDTTPIPVGRLALREGEIYFEYTPAFIARAIEISPFHCPLRAGVQQFPRTTFDGLAGVFYDSLPDGWGLLLLDRALRKQGQSLAALSPLDNLAHVGHNGMGALVYQPDYNSASMVNSDAPLVLDNLATAAQNVLKGAADDVLDDLLALNGSSGGARPKATIEVDATRQNIVHGAADIPADFESWLVKFPNLEDGNDAGAVEYAYALMAQKAGVEMSATHLFAARNSAGYFATKRFERTADGKRLHMHSAAGLLHMDFRMPSLDYEDLLTLTHHLSGDISEVEKMFRLAVFNVLAHNRDDHAKNFSFLMDEAGAWRVAPAYDLTFSSGINGEQSTTLLGEGKAPSIEGLVKLGQGASLAPALIDDALSRTRAALGDWQTLANTYGVSNKNIRLIASHHTALAKGDSE